MRILGIDPGLRITGYGLIDFHDNQLDLIEAGVVRTQSTDGISDRLTSIYDGLGELFSEKKPDVVVLEKLFSHSKHPSTAILMGHARGVVCLLAGIHKVPLVNLPSTRVKKSIVSNGHASKEQIAFAVQSILHLKQCPKPVDVTDALSIAISFAWTESDKFEKVQI